MNIDNIICELRELEGVNASFDYGVELLVMALKQYANDLREDNIAGMGDIVRFRWRELFRYDKVCRNGFEVANNRLLELV